MEVEINFYTTESGRSPVEAEILKLDRDSRAKVLAHLEYLGKHGGKIGEPHVKSLGRGLKELRTSIYPNSYRTLYFMHWKNTIMLVHSFKKKTQKTPKKDMDLAIKRMKDWIGRN